MIGSSVRTARAGSRGPCQLGRGRALVGIGALIGHPFWPECGSRARRPHQNAALGSFAVASAVSAHLRRHRGSTTAGQILRLGVAFAPAHGAMAGAGADLHITRARRGAPTTSRARVLADRASPASCTCFARTQERCRRLARFSRLPPQRRNLRFQLRNTLIPCRHAPRIRTSNFCEFPAAVWCPAAILKTTPLGRPGSLWHREPVSASRPRPRAASPPIFTRRRSA